MPQHYKALTHRHQRIQRIIYCKATLTEAFNPFTTKVHPHGFEVTGIWDTGASNTVITPQIVLALNLKPTRPIKVHTARGVSWSSGYLVNIILPGGIGFAGFEVTEGDLPPGTDMLIGMDIITQGDFAITNKDSQTYCSFRSPSIKRIDFVDELEKSKISKTGRKKKKRMR